METEMKAPDLTALAGRAKPSETHTELDVDKQIRDRAFELYEQRGREDGHALDDWLQAEREVLQDNPKGSAA